MRRGRCMWCRGERLSRCRDAAAAEAFGGIPGGRPAGPRHTCPDGPPPLSLPPACRHVRYVPLTEPGESSWEL